jgi:type I restriction enzyme S subunit
MQVKTGYQQTDIGCIPVDWKVAKVRSFARITTGAKNTQDRIADGAYPFFVRSQIVERINSYSFDGEAILTAGDGVGTGKVFHYINGRFDLHQRVYKISDFKEHVDGYYFYLFFSRSFLARVMSMTAKSSVDSVRMEMIADMLTPVPPKPEQTAIATVLSDTDAIIQNLEKLIAKKRAIKQGAMQELLTGKRRLPGFEGNGGFQKTEVGKVPADWAVVRMGDVGQTFIGLTYSPNCVAEHGVLVLRSSNVQNGKLAYEDNVFVQMDLPPRVMVQEGDILICVRNGSRQLIGKCALIDKSAGGAAFGAFMSLYRSNHSPFIFRQFQSAIIQRQINETLGATINQITNKDMARFLVCLPKNPAEGNAIVEVLSDMDSELSALESKLSKYRTIKQGMMQELLTGKTRLV